MAFERESDLKFWTGLRKSYLLDSAKVEGSILLDCVGNAFSGNDNVVSRACHNSQVSKYNRFLPTPQYKILDERGYACLHSHSQICQQKNLTFDRPQSLTNRTLWLVQQTRTKLNQWANRVFPVLEAFCFNLDTFGSSLALLLFCVCSCVFRGGRNYFGFGCSRNHLFFVDLFLLHLWSLVMKKIEFRAAAIIRIQKNVKMFMAICRHKPR